MRGLLLGARDIQIGLALIEVALGDGARFDERLGSFYLGLGELNLCRRARDFGLGAVDRDLEWARVDGEEDVASLDDLAILEVELCRRKPETRGRTSTISDAAKRPEYSSHCVTRLRIGAATATGMAGGSLWART